MGNENAKAPPPGAFLFALCWEWKDNSPIALLLSTPVSCLPLPTSIFRIFIGACIISSQDLNTNRVIGSPVKKEWKICHFIISSSFMLCNVATVPPLSSLGHLQKKNKKKKNIASTHRHLLCYGATVPPLYWVLVKGPSLFIRSSINHLNLHPEYVSNFSRPVFIQSGIYISSGLVFWIRISSFTTPSFSISIYKEKMVPISPFQISFNIGSTSPLDMSTGSRFLLLPLKASFRKILKRKCIQFLPSSLQPWNNISFRHDH